MGNSCVVNSNGKRETCPATANGRKAPRWRRSCKQSSRNGMTTSKMAFSCTCQPKRKEEYAVSVRAPKKVVGVGLKKSLMRAGFVALVRYVVI
jgi:hypothetical protein